MHRNLILLSFVLIHFSTLITAQDVKDMTFGQRIFIGGDFGMTFGTNTYINISPYVGYRITNRLSAGLGPIYIYERYKYYDIKTSTYGGKAIMSFIVLKDIGQNLNIGLGNIMLHTENEILNIEKIYFDYNIQRYVNTQERVWIDNWLIGAGLNQSFGSRGGINLYILWDLTQNQYSPYSNPVVKIGFYF